MTLEARRTAAEEDRRSGVTTEDVKGYSDLILNLMIDYELILDYYVPYRELPTKREKV